MSLLTQMRMLLCLQVHANDVPGELWMEVRPPLYKYT